MIVLGIDTSNYTTSAALYDSAAGVLYQKRRLLKVKSGELGLRQADAVFQHTIALPEIIDELYSETKLKPDVIAVSVILNQLCGCLLKEGGSRNSASCSLALGNIKGAFFIACF